MAKDLNLTILLDVYGQLLTEKQRDAVDMYYNEDLSLAEIAERINISRQGVLASIRQGEKHLAEFEKQLGVVKRFQTISAKLSAIKNLLNETEFNEKKAIKDILSEIEREI